MPRTEDPRRLAARLEAVLPGSHDYLVVMFMRLIEQYGREDFSNVEIVAAIRDLMWEGEMPPELGIDLIRQIKAGESPLGVPLGLP